MVPLVIYHKDCADGFTAAWSFWKIFPNWEYYPAKHGDPPPTNIKNREVYMVDFSYKKPVIEEMAKEAKYITIIDHHKSAEIDLVDLPVNVTVKFDMNHSGAYLAWQWFHTVYPVPDLVIYVEDRDLWKFRYDCTKAFSAALFAEEYNFTTWNLWNQKIKSEGIGWAIQAGEAILRKQTKDINELLQNKFRMKISGYEVWACNLPYTLASEAGNILSKGELFGATFYYDGNNLKFSLRSDDNGIDVSKIAVGFGGGGHFHAAGFSIGSNFMKEIYNNQGELNV
jgi:oligoribonuclease NrnB/cAMP/cGMP phosphodiesterase (DHH superfamily)